MCEANQERFDEECPADFQSAGYLSGWGQLDMVLEEGDGEGGNSQARIQEVVGRVSGLLLGGRRDDEGSEGSGRALAELAAALAAQTPSSEEEKKQEASAAAIDMNVPFDYRYSVSRFSMELFPDAPFPSCIHVFAV